MYLCILDQAGTIVLHKEVPAEPAAFLEAIAPYRDGLVVACECLFCWYWLADLCQAENIAFVLGHALYMKAIHGGKSKDDKIDSKKIAHLLRGGNLPIAYAYPKGLRETRDLLRRRMYLVHKRAEVVAHVSTTSGATVSRSVSALRSRSPLNNQRPIGKRSQVTCKIVSSRGGKG
jgi:transposase